jgi:hypothetical protein
LIDITPRFSRPTRRWQRTLMSDWSASKSWSSVA